MSEHLVKSRDDLFAWQQRLEEQLLDAVREFERQTGMVVMAMKRYPGAWHDGRPCTRAIEVVASLR